MAAFCMPYSPKGTPRLRLGSGHFDAVTVGPDRAVIQVMLHVTPQRFHQLLSAFQLKADHIHDDIGLEIENLLCKCPVLDLDGAVQRNLADGIPGCVRLVRVALAPTNRRHLVPLRRPNAAPDRCLRVRCFQRQRRAS